MLIAYQRFSEYMSDYWLNQPTRLVFGTQWFMFTVLVTFSLLYFSSTSSTTGFIFYLSIILVFFLAWSIWSWWRVTRSFFDPYVIFLIAATLFNGGGLAFLEVLGINQQIGGFLGGRFSDNSIVESLLLAVLGLFSYHLGGLFAATYKTEMPAINKSEQDIVLERYSLRVVGWLLLGIAILPTIMTLRDAVSTVLSGGYFALYQREVVTGFASSLKVLSAFMVPGTLFLLAGSKGRFYSVSVSLVLILTYVSIRFFLGERSWAVMPLLAYAWVWHRAIKPLPSTLLLSGGAILGFVVFPLIKVVRNIEGGARDSFYSYIEGFLTLDNPVVAVLEEIGGSISTVVWTIELVPAVRDFDWGLSYVYAVSTVFPNLFWDIHPAVKHGLASHWLVWEVAPHTAALGGGYGYSFIAEAYLNFGWIGTPIVLILLGYLFARLVLWANTVQQPLKLAAVASFVAFFFMFARSESGTIVRPLLWYAFLPYALTYFVMRFKIGVATLRPG